MSWTPDWTDIVNRTGWMLLHSLWQFALIGVLYRLLAIRTSSPIMRCRWGLTLLSLTPILAITTYVLAPSNPNHEARSVTNRSLDSQRNLLQEEGILLDRNQLRSAFQDQFGRQDLSRRPQHGKPSLWLPWSNQGTISFQDWLPPLVGLWLIGVILLSVRPLLLMRTSLLLARRNVAFPTDRILQFVRRVSHELNMSVQVQVRVSTWAYVPAVAGLFRPTIILPVAMLTGLSTQQVELILRHELAHIARRDSLWNLVQTFLETLWFYHPGVWWISRSVRQERELCCDDMAAPESQSAKVLAHALFRLEEQKLRPLHVPTIHGGSLRDRISRLLSGEPRRPNTVAWPNALATFSFVFAILTVATLVVSTNSLSAQPANRTPTVQETKRSNQLASSNKIKEHLADWELQLLLDQIADPVDQLAEWRSSPDNAQVRHPTSSEGKHLSESRLRQFNRLFETSIDTLRRDRQGQAIRILIEDRETVFSLPYRVLSSHSKIHPQVRHELLYVSRINLPLALRVIRLWEAEVQECCGLLDLFVAEPALMRIETNILHQRGEEASNQLRTFQTLLKNNFAPESLIASVRKLEKSCHSPQKAPSTQSTLQIESELAEVYAGLEKAFEERLTRVKQSQFNQEKVRKSL